MNVKVLVKKIVNEVYEHNKELIKCSMDIYQHYSILLPQETNDYISLNLCPQ